MPCFFDPKSKKVFAGNSVDEKVYSLSMDKKRSGMMSFVLDVKKLALPNKSVIDLFKVPGKQSRDFN